MLAEKVNDAFLRKELEFGLVSISHPPKGTVITLLAGKLFLGSVDRIQQTSLVSVGCVLHSCQNWHQSSRWEMLDATIASGN